MHQAKILALAGHSKTRIAQILEVDRRTVYNYLTGRVFKEGTAGAGRPSGSRKLTPFHDYIEQELENDLYINGSVLFDKLVSMGYPGKSTILYEHLHKRREEMRVYAVMRYETVPGQQAQVDWTECGSVWENGTRKKRYCFVMKLGYSRRSYMEFTTSMQQPILFACMKRGFEYFGGIPLEILFDNMKTAFHYDHQEGTWVAHPKMLAFAAHYGFTPKRCRVRRPQTKGKVEREIRYLKSSFFPMLRLEGVRIDEVCCDKLNDRLRSWLIRVDGKELRQFGQTRLERFKSDRSALKSIPQVAYDHRVIEPLTVSLDGTITFQTNRYSVDAAYRGKVLDGRYDPDTAVMSLYFEAKLIKEIALSHNGAKDERIDPADHLSLVKAWEVDRRRYEAHVRRRVEKKKHRAQAQNVVVHPSVYDQIFGTAASQAPGVAL